MNINAGTLTRDEQELLAYFRALPTEQQGDLLAAAETSCNAFARMKELATREIERGFRDEVQISGWQ